MRGKFAVFILSHGRADRVYTLDTLRKGGYTGKVYVVIDNEDKTADEYYKRYGEAVVMFDKLDIAKRYDTGDNFSERRAIFYARNACFEMAKDLGLDYFLELDDDYTSFEFRKPKDGKLLVTKCKQLDRLFASMVEFLEVSGASTVALGQGGDYIGGVQSGNLKKFMRDGVLRKAMNTFFCKTSRPFEFVGRVNEDVNTYTTLGMRGKLLMTVPYAAIVQKQTQSNSGGMTDLYLDSGTYLKSFYAVMYAPSCVKISIMEAFHKRIHHHISWANCTPMILNQKYKKGEKK